MGVRHENTNTTKNRFPLACAAIKAGRYAIREYWINSVDTGRKHPITVVYAGPKVVAGPETPALGLRWIEDHELELAAVRAEQHPQAVAS